MIIFNNLPVSLWFYYLNFMYLFSFFNISAFHHPQLMFPQMLLTIHKDLYITIFFSRSQFQWLYSSQLHPDTSRHRSFFAWIQLIISKSTTNNHAENQFMTTFMAISAATSLFILAGTLFVKGIKEIRTNIVEEI